MNRRMFVLSVFALLTFAAACSDRNDGGNSTPSPSHTSTTAATSTTTTTATPSPVPTSAVRSLTMRAAEAPPPRSQLFIVTGCEACDGPDETLQLHQTDAAGITTVTTVLGPGHAALGGMTIGQIDAAADGTVLAVAACADTYCGGLGNRQQAIDWRFLISVNDGADWTVAYETRANYAYLEQVTAEGLIAGEVIPDGSIPSPQRHTVINLAGQKRLVTPPGAAGPLARAVMLGSGQVAWMEWSGGGPSGKLFREDGTQIPVPAGSGVDDVQPLADGRLALFSTGSESRVSLYAPGPNSTVRVLLGGSRPWGITWDGTWIVANNFVSGAGPNAIGPVLVDLATFTATPLTTDLLKNQTGRNRFVAYDVE